MNKKLELKIVKKFPDIYKGYYEAPAYSCLAFGFECEDGWFKLIYTVSKRINKYIKSKKWSEDERPEILQIKEKFGSLRIYMSNYDETIEQIIEDAEKLSVKICERCGSTENVSSIKGYWIKFLCDKCRLSNEDYNEK